MKNPWLKKNPFMSMWLSGAHRVVGAARGLAAATVKREATRASRDVAAAGIKQVLDFWGQQLEQQRPSRRPGPSPKSRPGPGSGARSQSWMRGSPPPVLAEMVPGLAVLAVVALVPMVFVAAGRGSCR